MKSKYHTIFACAFSKKSALCQFSPYRFMPYLPLIDIQSRDILWSSFIHHTVYIYHIQWVLSCFRFDNLLQHWHNCCRLSRCQVLFKPQIVLLVLVLICFILCCFLLLCTYLPFFYNFLETQFCFFPCLSPVIVKYLSLMYSLSNSRAIPVTDSLKLFHPWLSFFLSLSLVSKLLLSICSQTNMACYTQSFLHFLKYFSHRLTKPLPLHFLSCIVVCRNLTPVQVFLFFLSSRFYDCPILPVTIEYIDVN